MPKVGFPIHLNLQLFDGRTDVFVRAHVMDRSGNEIAGSPVACGHLSLGLYTNDSLIMPNLDHVKAVYKVYMDSSFSVPSTDHSDGIDVFYLEAPQSSVDLIGVIGEGHAPRSRGRDHCDNDRDGWGR